MKKYIPILIIVAVAVMVFAGGLFTQRHIESNDANPVSIADAKSILDNCSNNQGWITTHFAGKKSHSVPYNIHYFSTILFDPVFALKFTYFFSILLAGIFFYLLMRSHGLHQYAALFGAIGYMLTNSIITLILPGHHSKMQGLTWMPLVFLFLRKGVIENKIRCYIYSGFFLGLFFQGMAYQMSVYFSILAAFYFLHLLFKKREKEQSLKQFLQNRYKQLLSSIGSFSVLILTTLLIASILIPNFLGQSQSRSKQHSNITRSSQQQWEWATQWSIAPLEMSDFILPGIFGWKTRDKSHPYWGDLGKSPDGGKSLPNLKLHSDHIGMLVFIFLLFALFMQGKNRENEHRFWLAALLIAVALALGKYLYLPYYIFHNLPFMDQVRNPNKFFKIAAFAATILASYGFQYLFFREKNSKEQAKQKKFTTILTWFSGSLIFASVLSLFFLKSPFQDMVETKLGLMNLSRFGIDVSIAAENIADNLPIVFLLGGLLTGFAAYLFHVLQNKQKRNIIQLLTYATIALVGIELWLSARHFINYREKKYNTMYQADVLVNTFKYDKTSRVFFKQRTQFSNFYGRHKFPYHSINTVHINDLSKASGRYALLYNQLRRSPGSNKILQLLNINRIISLTSITNGSMQELKKIPLNRQQTRFLHIYKPVGALARAYTVTNFQFLNSAKNVANQLMSTNFDPATTAYLEKGTISPKKLFNVARSTNWSATSDTIKINSYANNSIELTAHSSGDRILIFQDYFDNEWQATINGSRSKIFPVNLLYRGIILPKGNSRIIFTFKPKGLFYKISMLGFFAVFIVFLLDAVPYIRKKHARNKTQEKNEENPKEI